VRCKLLDGVVAKDVVLRLMLPDELEESDGVLGLVEDVSVRKAFCRDKVRRWSTAEDGDDGVVARSVLVKGGVGGGDPLTDVVTNSEDVLVSAGNDLDIGVESSKVESVHLTLEAPREDDDRVEVGSAILMILDGEFDPIGMFGVQEVGDVVIGDVVDLGVCEEEALSIETRHL